jgi:Pyridoxamine 5'-phosphate oxidase
MHQMRINLAKIPKVLHEHINSAFPVSVCLVATVLQNGFAQVTPRGSTMVFDDEHLALWERGKGTTSQNLKDGSKITVFFRKSELRQAGILPKGGIARFYGVAELHKSGPIYEEIWNRLVQPEKDRDPEKKGFGVLIKVERVEDLDGAPLNLS